MQFQNAMIYTEKFRFEHGAFAVENGRFARVLGQPGPDAVPGTASPPLPPRR